MSHTDGSDMNITVDACRMASASTMATRSLFSNPATKLLSDPTVSEGSSFFCRLFACSADFESAVSPPPRRLEPTLAMKSSSFLFTWVITDSRALILASSASSSAFSTCASSACSAAMRFCAPRKARWISVAAVALLLMDAGVSMVPPRGARALCRVREAGASPDRTTQRVGAQRKAAQCEDTRTTTIIMQAFSAVIT